MLAPWRHVKKSNSVWTQQPFVPSSNSELGVDFIKIDRNSTEGLRNIEYKTDISRFAGSTYFREFKRRTVGPVAVRKGRYSYVFLEALKNRTGPVAIAWLLDCLQNCTCLIGKPAPDVDVRWKLFLKQKNYIA